jgi:hypothetical protein
MPNGKYEPQCGNCIHFSAELPARRNCSIHDFVMPLFHDYVLCSDWRAKWNESARHPFGTTIKPGFLYRREEYSRNPPAPVGPFDGIQEILLDRAVEVVENPERGWCIYIPQWDHAFYPPPGENALVLLDNSQGVFLVADIEVLITYTSRSSDGLYRSEDRVELKRAMLPVGNTQEILANWLDRHHGLAKAKTTHQRNLLNPRFLNKNKPVRFLERITGKPQQRIYGLQADIGVPDVPL